MSRPRVGVARKIADYIPCYGFLTENSYLFNLARREIFIMLQHKDENKNDVGLSGKVTDADFELSVRQSCEEFREIAELCGKNRIDIVVLVVPDTVNIRNGPNATSEQNSRILSETKNNLVKLGIPHIDLQEALSAWSGKEGVPLKNLFIPKDCHFSKMGDQAVAQIVKDWILKNWKTLKTQ